jgi:hypothetical protein
MTGKRVFAKDECEKGKRIAEGVLQKDKSKWEKRAKGILQKKNAKEEREFCERREEGKKSLAKEKLKRGMRVTNGVFPKTNIRRGSQLQKEFCERKR